MEFMKKFMLECRDTLLQYRKITLMDMIAFLVWSVVIVPKIIDMHFVLMVLLSALAGGLYGVMTSYLQMHFGTVNEKEIL